MARITLTPPEKAAGVVKEGYDMFMKNIGIIPKPMEMLSASPGLFAFQLDRIRYFSKHPSLGFALLAHIRYLVACQLNYSCCQDFNRHVLTKLGLEDREITAMENDPSKAMLEDNEKAMLAFVVKSVRDPGSVTDSDVGELRNLGWSDSDMMDALAQGVSMIDHSIMMQVFKIDQSCMV
ncbi:MAG: hypothetical protein V1793_17795 [Pseudomonadota bacterium]